MGNCVFIGRSTIDLMSFVDVMPSPDQKVNALADFIGGGGSALNAAIACHSLGSDAHLWTCLGKDHLYKSIVMAELDEHQVSIVDLSLDENYQLPLSNIISAKQTASRLIVNASQPDCEEVVTLNPNWLEDTSIVLLDQYEHPFVMANQRALAEFSGDIVLDAGTWKAHSELFLSLCTIPIVSEEFTSGDKDKMQALCDKYGITKWAMTLGEKGVFYSDESGSGIIAAPKVDAIDTLGAGDIFHGTFCHYYSQSNDFRESLSKASEIAALSCTELGTRSWLKHIR
ncbi:PfkB family carbohydrate kinase [Photobacterium chitinilyticum]|uniref:PfkB family carbohydrate kinase n=1 Tax=Photobacterium chitinilyticum TaxID=2485123 RepID=UPI003D106659